MTSPCVVMMRCPAQSAGFLVAGALFMVVFVWRELVVSFKEILDVRVFVQRDKDVGVCIWSNKPFGKIEVEDQLADLGDSVFLRWDANPEHREWHWLDERCPCTYIE